VIFYFRI